MTSRLGKPWILGGLAVLAVLIVLLLPETWWGVAAGRGFGRLEMVAKILGSDDEQGSAGRDACRSLRPSPPLPPSPPRPARPPFTPTRERREEEEEEELAFRIARVGYRVVPASGGLGDGP